MVAVVGNQAISISLEKWLFLDDDARSRQVDTLALSWLRNYIVSIIGGEATNACNIVLAGGYRLGMTESISAA